jgi:hypothetical protein
MPVRHEIAAGGRAGAPGHAPRAGRLAASAPAAVLAACTIAALAPPAAAFQFSQGEVDGSLDTTLSYGAAWRVAGRDDDIVGRANGGHAFSVNGDDGNLNYDRGLYSHVVKATSELELSYKDVSAFLRGRAFYDFAADDTERTDLSGQAKDQVLRKAEFLDAYLTARFRIGEAPGQVRVGDQVLSWGESTFIQNSINAINPVDVAAIRLPGSELREALLPEGMVSASLGVTEDLSLEAFYLYDWDKTQIDPPGSYFATNDFAGDGGDTVLLGFGDAPDSLTPDPTRPAFPGSAVPRDPDRRPDDQGQWGVAARLFVPELNDTEFGFYYLNYHSRLPIINAHTGEPGATNYAATASYFISYPEDIQLLGASFNTSIGASGIALQGEVSHRLDMPLQIDDVELLFAALTPAFGCSPPVKQNQLGCFSFDEDVTGFVRRDVTQVQATASKFFSRVLGADNLFLIAEAAVMHVHDMPNKGDLRLESSGTYTSGDPFHESSDGGHPGKPAEPASAFADATSWGYRAAARLTYNNALGPINLLPRIAWQHDVSGNSPGPGGPFLEGRKAVTLGLTGTYQNQWSADVAYTNFFGAGRYNLLHDRDFIAFNVKYAF